jgi:hypothetical protein
LGSASLLGTDLRPVGDTSIRAGIALTWWFAAEARRIDTMFSESEDERELRRLIEFIRARGNRITVRQLMRGNCRRFPDATSAEGALSCLVDSGQAKHLEDRERCSPRAVLSQPLVISLAT